MKTVALPETLLSSDRDYARPRYSTQQAASYVGLSYYAFYVRVQRHEISFVRYGKGRGALIKFSQADLDAWMGAQRVESVNGPVVRQELSRRPAGALVAMPQPSRRRFA